MDWDRLSVRWPLIRDFMIVVTALGLIIFEAVLYGGPVRQSLLLLYSGLLVTPVFLRADQRRSDGQPTGPDEPREVES